MSSRSCVASLPSIGAFLASEQAPKRIEASIKPSVGTAARSAQDSTLACVSFLTMNSREGAMRKGDAVRLTATDGDVEAGTLGVVVETYPISEPDVVLLAFVSGKRLVPLTSVEEVTAVGAT